MTREDVLNKHSVGEIFNDGIVFDGCTDSIYSAMDEYASHIAISFLDWAHDNHWVGNGKGSWLNTHDAEWSMKTTPQLYSLYLETNINKQKQ